jgi:chromosome segregation ATPase
VGVDADEAGVLFAEIKAPPGVASQTQADGFTGDIQDQEGLLFENQKLTRKVHDLVDRLSEIETRAASLQYRVATLSEDNKRLEMGYTGASTQARGLEKLVRDLTAEIKVLKEGNAGQRPKAAS